MPIKSDFYPDHLYFVTASATSHLHLFGADSAKRLIVDSLHFLHSSGRMNLFAFVVMPNHIHLIGRFSADYSPADAVRDFKRHTARQLLAELKARERKQMLSSLRELNTDVRQEYKVWEDNFDARDALSPEFLQQKMDYIHLNPCQPQWRLVEDPVDYIWSSARFYMADLPAIIPVDDVREFLS